MSEHEIEILKKRIAELEKLDAERKKAEADLRLNAEIMRNIAEGIVLIRVRDAVIVYTNPKFEKMFGYGPGELVGKNISVVNAPTDKSPEEVAEEIKKCLREKGVWQGEVYNKKKDGTPFWCYASVSTFSHPEYGEVWVTVHTDITERKKAEEVLKESEERYRGLVSSVDLGVTVMDAEYNIVSVNKTISRLFNKDAQSFIGKKCFHEFEKREEVCPHCPGVKAMQDKKSHSVETRGVRDDGATFFVKNYAVPILKSDGTIKGFMEIIENITERKKNEELVLSLNEQLQTIFDASPAMIFYKDKENRFIRVNEALAKANGITKKEMVGKTMWDIYPKEAAEHYWKDDKEVMASGKPKLNIIESMETPKGTVWVETNKISYRDPKGDIIGIIGFAADITERKQAEAELRKKMHDLEVFHKAAVGRELKMEELKKRIKELEKKS